MTTNQIAFGDSGEMLAGELFVSKQEMLSDDSCWLPERVCITAGNLPVQWVNLRPGLWEFWLEHDGHGLVHGVRLQSLYSSGPLNQLEQFRHSEGNTWQLGRGFLKSQHPSALIQQHGTLGLVVHLLSEESTCGMVFNADRQVEQFYFVTDGLRSETIQCEYLEAIFYGDFKIDGFEMRWGFWRTAVSDEGYLLVHHDSYPEMSQIRWMPILTVQLAKLFQQLGLDQSLWANHRLRMVGLMLDSAGEVTGMIITPFPIR